jgi:hypothetical protein
MCSLIIDQNKGINKINETNSVHLVSELLGTHSVNTKNLVIKNTDITKTDKNKQLVVFLDSPNILRF